MVIWLNWRSQEALLWRSDICTEIWWIRSEGKESVSPRASQCEGLRQEQAQCLPETERGQVRVQIGESKGPRARVGKKRWSGARGGTRSHSRLTLFTKSTEMSGARGVGWGLSTGAFCRNLCCSVERWGCPQSECETGHLGGIYSGTYSGEPQRPFCLFWLSY